VKSTGQQQNKCTFRVPTATEANEWANLLERTKKVLLSQAEEDHDFDFKHRL
jgi:hypothetical protein